MKKEITTQELENLRYRKKRLRGKLVRLERLLSGGGTGPLPLVRGEDGKWSEEGGRELVQTLLDTLDLSLRGQGEETEISCPLSQLPPALGPEQREFFESFFYCALRALESPPPGPAWPGPLGGTWAQLVDLARETGYTDRYTLYFDEQYRGVSGLFAAMDQMYEALAGEPAVRRASPQDIQIMEERFETEITAQEELPLWDAFPKEVQMEFSEPSTSFDRGSEERQEAAFADWRKSFPEQEAFCREYLRFRELYFTAEGWRYLGAWTEQAVDLYLYREGTSGFLNDESYFLAYGLLDRAERQLRRALREG